MAAQNDEFLGGIPKACFDELKAVEYFEQQRWGGNPACPHCGVLEVKQLRDKLTKERNKRFLWVCKGCKQQFTVKVGTVMEDSKIPYHVWYFAFWAACSSKKGVSAMQIHRQTGLSYKSALFMMHRIRAAMANDTPVKLTGDVEVDEVYLGGKERNKHANKKARRGPLGVKTPVIAMLQRGGRVVTKIMPIVNGQNIRHLLYRNVERSAHIFTDESVVYNRVRRFFKRHEKVNHSAGEYVRGSATTNTVEGFFGLVRRCMMGTWHAVSLKHLHRYLGEIEFKYNTCKLKDFERLALAVRGADGKRLTYRALVA